MGPLIGALSLTLPCSLHRWAARRAAWISVALVVTISFHLECRLTHTKNHTPRAQASHCER